MGTTDEPSSAVRDYLSQVGHQERTALERILTVAREVAPETEEGRSYGMPVLRYRGKQLIGFVAAKQHLSLFPFSATVVDGVRDRLEGFDLSKGTIRFTLDRPIPDDVLREVVSLRMAEIERGRPR